MPMRVVGVEIAKTDVHWLLLDGAVSSGSIVHMSSDKLELPKSEASAVENYLTLKNLILADIAKAQPGKVTVIKATRYASVDRAKIELLFQLACHEINIPCELIHPVTISTIMKKKFVLIVGQTPEDAFNGGAEISPKHLIKPFYCAWKGIHG